MEINKLYNQNCLTTMRLMPEGFIDLTVTSPPYDALRDYKGFKFPFKHIARQLYRVTTEGGVVVWVVADQTINGSESGTSFRQALFFMECGFRLHDTMIFKKSNFVPLTHNRYEQCFEYMFILSKGKPKAVNLLKEKTSQPGYISKLDSHKEDTSGNYAMRKRKNKYVTGEFKIRPNLFEYACGNQESSFHVAPFPDDLAAEQIFSWSNEGDLVYDPFAGSGTTIKMAHQYKRNWIASEISEEYCNSINKRLIPYLTQKTIFD